jgi:muramoyltetrapeptide carboxypeptidase
LTQDDEISVVAPAGAVVTADLEAGLAWLGQWLMPVRHGDLLARDGYLAGDDACRAAAFQEAIDSPTTRAVIAARGGFGTTKILDDIDLTRFLDRPKWLVGSSDLTALLVEVWARHRIPTIHGPMVTGLGRTDSGDLAQLKNLLTGRPWQPPTELQGLSSGSAVGPLVGGNLTVLAHLAGALPPDFSDGAVLFLEDVSEKPYRLDRSLTQLERAGFLENVSGILLGEFTGCAPGSDGTTAEMVMEKHFSTLSIPVATGYPAAHGPRNAPFIHGAAVTLDIQGSRAELKTAAP